MIRIALSFAALLLAPAALGQVPSPPAEAANPSEDAAYLELFRVMQSGVDQELMLDRGLDQMRTAFLAANPVLRAMEREEPGVLAQMFAAIRPVLIRHSERIQREAEPAIAAAFRGQMTAQDAREAAAFYGSPLGRRLLAGISENHTYRAVARDAASGDEAISREALEADSQATTDRMVNELSEADLIEIGRLAYGRPWVARLRAAQPALLAVRVEMENAPMNEADQAAIEALVEAVIAKRVAAD